MPSWGVHLGIANKVLKNIDNVDKNLFMFGNVTPDIKNGYVIKLSLIHISEPTRQ